MLTAKNRLQSGFAAVVMFVLTLANMAPGTALAAPPDSTADVVYGQLGSFTTNTINPVSANSLNFPDGAVLDSSGNLYIADTNNQRVLFYPAGSTTATRVYGQGGSFTTANINNGGISANSLSVPRGLALDSIGNLYLADAGNARVLFYPVGSTTATRVYGQGGNFTTDTVNNGGISANSLSLLAGIALDSNDNLYAADYNNSRVLFYPAGLTTATRVYGQGGSFTTSTANNGGISANSLSFPNDVAVDSGDNLYVTDSNNRVLFYPMGFTTATRVYGQGGSFTTNTANNGGVSANSLKLPLGVALDNQDNLYVADQLNNRVLFYPAGNTTATFVYGQLGSFTTNTANNGGINADSLSQPRRVVPDGNSGLYVVDEANNRALKYLPPPCPTTFTFDFSGAQYDQCFRDVQRGGEIDDGLDVGNTGHSSLRFTGLTGSGGATWLTVYDATPTTPTPGPVFGAQTLCADILFARFNNIKGAGIVALLNEGPDQKGLALIVSDAGNTDLLRLATIEGDATKKGKFTVLNCGVGGNPCSVPLKNGIAENVWYRLIMTVDPAVPSVTGKVFTHTTPSDPNSDLGFKVGTTLTYEPGVLPAGVLATGENALLAQAVSAVVDLSITNFTNDPDLCRTPPE
jgi:sugar lactone lactonase YvrE